MSRPSMPNKTDVSKNGAQAKKIELIGYAYHESFNPHGIRVYVPGHLEDFWITNLRGSRATSVLDTWIKFGAFAETMKFDPEAPLQSVPSPTPSKRGTIVLLCEKEGDTVRTVSEGHVVTDPDNELGFRGLAENFKLELRLRLKSGPSNKPTFVVDKIQPTLPTRIPPREPVKAQSPQTQRYSTVQTRGRNQNSNLPRYMCPVTSGNWRPRPVFHNATQHQHTPPPSFGNARPQGTNEEFLSRRSSALSVDYHNPPRNFGEPTTSQNYSYSSERAYTGGMQYSQAENDKKIADLVHEEWRTNPEFRDMLTANFPEFTSRLRALL